MTRISSTQTTWGLALLLGLGTTAVALFKVWPTLFPTIVERAPLNAECSLRAAPCSVHFADGSAVYLAIRPREIPLLQPLQLEVRLRGMDAQRAEVDFVGVDMDMGFNRPPLKREGPHHFSGTATLPVCVRDTMEWEAKVLLHTDDGIYAAPFRFATHRDQAQ